MAPHSECWFGVGQLSAMDGSVVWAVTMGGVPAVNRVPPRVQPAWVLACRWGVSLMPVFVVCG